MILRRLLVATALVMSSLQPAPDPTPPPTLLGVTRIWDAGAHNAFTDLVRWRDRWYCVFREGDGHVGGDGRIRVLTSADGDAWQSAALIAEAGVDLRDPKVSTMPDGRLMLVMGGSVYDGTRLVGMQSRVAFSADGADWTAPARVLDEGEWLWRVMWHEGVAHGVSYRPVPGGEWTVRLVSSRDGRTFAPVATDAGRAAGVPGRLQVSGRPNEATLRIASDGEMIALLRRDGGDAQAWLGRSRAPFTAWAWTPVGHRVGGPNLVRLPDGRWFAAGRSHVDGIHTVLAALTLDGRYRPVLTLPSGGDTSYPGLVWHDGVLWMSYYSSHEGTTAIYLARIRV